MIRDVGHVGNCWDVVYCFVLAALGVQAAGLDDGSSGGGGTALMLGWVSGVSMRSVCWWSGVEASMNLVHGIRDDCDL